MLHGILVLLLAITMLILLRAFDAGERMEAMLLCAIMLGMWLWG